MSVSVLEAPDAISGNKISSVERPLFWDVQSDRVEVLTFSITAVTDAAGFANYNVGLHDVKIGDVVTITGVNDDYNGRQTVIEVLASTIKTDKAYVNTLGAGGTLQRTNDNFKVKAIVYKGDLDEENIASVADNGGSAQLTIGTHSHAVGDTVAVSDTTNSFSIISVVNSGGGKCLYSIGAHSITEGETINVQGITTDPSYNGIQQVIFATGTTIVTNRNFGVAVGAEGTLSYQVYDGVHVVTASDATTITIDEPFTVDSTGKVIEVTVIASKFQQEVTEDGNKLFRFNVADMIKSELSFSLATIGATEVISPNTGSITNYTITFTEQFDDADGLLRDNHSIQTSVDYKGCNIALQHTEVQDLNIFTVDNSTKRFLTNKPTSNLIGDTDKDEVYQAGDVIQMHFLHTAGDQVRGRITEFDDSLSVLNTTNTALVDIVIHRGILRIDTGSFNALTTFFTVELLDAGGSNISESYRFCLDKKCYPNSRNIVFLNRYGGFDSYRMTRRLTSTVKTNKTTYQRGLDKNFNISDRGESVIGSRSFDEREIWSTWLNEGQTYWLEELYTSKHVYLVEEVNGTDEYIPIVITDRRQVMRETDNMTQIRIRYKRPELIING